MLKSRLSAIIACPYPGPYQLQSAPHDEQPPSSHIGFPSGPFLPHIFSSSSLAHLMPLLRISLLFSISVSGNLPFFLNMMLKHSPSTQRAMRINAAKKISTSYLVDEA